LQDVPVFAVDFLSRKFAIDFFFARTHLEKNLPFNFLELQGQVVCDRHRESWLSNDWRR